MGLEALLVEVPCMLFNFRFECIHKINCYTLENTLRIRNHIHLYSYVLLVQLSVLSLCLTLINDNLTWSGVSSSGFGERQKTRDEMRPTLESVNIK